MDPEDYLKEAERYLAECDEHLEMARLINEHLEVLYDRKPPPSEELGEGWA